MAKKKGGKTEDKLERGRPLKFKTVKELETKIVAYFAQCDKDHDPYTVSGLALALDTTRETLLDYQDRDDFSDTIKKAKLRCENFAERKLFRGSGSVAGVIFSLKNNYKGWKDTKDVHHGGSIAQILDAAEEEDPTEEDED